jgi:hypothetical protein
MGRPRKLNNGDVARVVGTLDKTVVVDYRFKWHHGEYRVIPLDKRGRMRGDAKWIRATHLRPTGTKNHSAGYRTYRANASLGDRGCACQCCIHEAYSAFDWSNNGRYLG